MRLTGGQGRGRPIKGPRGLGLRPTADRVREALFDILGARVEEAQFLDAFAGTGAVGIEALSRGARRVVFLERDRRAIRLIAENLALGAWSGSSCVMEGDVGGSISRLAREGTRFSIVFLDPPYEAADYRELLMGAARILEPEGILVLEHRSSTRIESLPAASVRPLRTYRYGDTSLTTLLPAATRG